MAFVSSTLKASVCKASKLCCFRLSLTFSSHPSLFPCFHIGSRFLYEMLALCPLLVVSSPRRRAVSLRVIQRASVQTPLASLFVSTDFYPLNQTRCFFWGFFCNQTKENVIVNLCKIAKILRGCVGVDVGSVTKGSWLPSKKVRISKE